MPPEELQLTAKLRVSCFMTINFIKVKCRRNICTQVLTIPISYLVVAADEVKATGGNAVENKGDCE